MRGTPTYRGGVLLATSLTQNSNVAENNPDPAKAEEMIVLRNMRISLGLQGTIAKAGQ